MKIRKHTEQKNFTLATEYYTCEEIAAMESEGKISDLSKLFPDSFDSEHYVVFCSECSEIKVVYNAELGQYCTVAVHNDGTEIHVDI